MMINTLLKEKIITRTTNPVRSTVLGMLVDNAKKYAKSQLREATDDDIGISAKKMKNENLKAIEEYKKGNGDYSHLVAENSILEEFIPQGMTEEQIKEKVDTTIISLSVENRNIKNIMTELKKIDGIDMKIAKVYVDNFMSM